MVVQTRYGRVVDHTRQLLNVPTPSVTLFRRARYAKWALFGLFVGVSCFLTLSLIILVSMPFPAPVQVASIVGIFGMGRGAMLLGLWCEVLELWASFKGLALEYSIFQDRTGEQSKL